MSGLVRRAAGVLPKGTPITSEMFDARHRGLRLLLGCHVVGLAIFGVIRDTDPVHLALELAAITFVAAAAGVVQDRAWRAGLATLGLVSCSALLVHLSGGLIEAHFHFFIVVILVTLYQSWFPFLLALLFVVLHHGTVGVVDPESVYNHPAAIERPWLWAGIHGLFVTGAAVASLVAWKHVELERARAEHAAVRLHERTVRQRQAMELNDTIVQGLVTVKYATEAGRAETAAATVERTLNHAQGLVAELMEVDGETFAPGSLRRDTATHNAGVT